LIREFEEGLQERGYVEGRNLDIEHRFAEGRADRVLAVAAELAKLTVDVLVTTVDGDRRPAG
jgi:putative ABC transport system substrate-binding protein